MVRAAVLVAVVGCTTVQAVGVRGTATHDEHAAEATATIGGGIGDDPRPARDGGASALLGELEGGLGIARRGGAEGHVSACAEFFDIGRTAGWDAHACTGVEVGEYLDGRFDAAAGVHWNVSRQPTPDDDLDIGTLAVDLLAGYAYAGDPVAVGGSVGIALSYRHYHQRAGASLFWTH